MKLLNILGWFFALVCLLFFITTLILGKALPSLPLFLAFLIVMPLTGKLFKRKGVKITMIFVRLVLVLAMFFAFMILSFKHEAQKPLYSTIELQHNLMEIYDTKMSQWPLEYESIWIETAYGQVHVIVSGNEAAPPLLLFHATSMANWSWLYNAKALAKSHRLYAIDFIGEPGKCFLQDIHSVPMNGKSLSAFYGQIADALGIIKADLIGASFGGFIALQYAIDYPERTGRIALLGPMGVTPATPVVVAKLILYQLFPLKIFQKKMTFWALGDDPGVLEETKSWFDLVLNGVTRKGAPPMTFKPEQLQKVESPVLLILGDHDQLVGNPEKVKSLAENMKDLTIHVLSSAHLIGIEQSDQVNTIAKSFLTE